MVGRTAALMELELAMLIGVTEEAANGAGLTGKVDLDSRASCTVYIVHCTCTVRNIDLWFDKIPFQMFASWYEA